MSCSICLSKFKNPVSIPCGHVYCTDCLTNHVAATSNDDVGFMSNCPTCREPFNCVSPQLNCIPRRLHQYILPSVRRVYVEPSSSSASLRKELAAAEKLIRALERDNERLVNERDNLVVAKEDALYRESLLEEENQELRQSAEMDAIEAADALKALKSKYNKLKQHCRTLKEENGQKDLSAVLLNVSKRNSSAVDASLTDAEASTPKRLRMIRPLPHRSRLSLQTPTKNGEQLGSPFRT
ncbi:RING-type domain-containing protein [Mycena indigotica]|uniref:RING-type domain-containing protein n=1 Tax=Mycena indigotica TaxID=2126181 RepID=A0A8H6W8S0_9AGAR|nr:RING-type domain-containing protein [Mycena indigotica]KAF7309914.1 RING-type domain-containing protein [Mycena indigotica]